LKSLEQAAEERGQRPSQVVRSLLFRESKGAYLMVLVAGPEQIDWKKLRQHLGTSRVTMASRSEVLQVTGYELGAVAPFGLPQPLPILVDRSVFAEEEVSMGSGVRNVAIILKSADLRAALGEVEVVDLKET
jgi:Cys-tRNA(Pro) deacylase